MLTERINNILQGDSAIREIDLRVFRISPQEFKFFMRHLAENIVETREPLTSAELSDVEQIAHAMKEHTPELKRGSLRFSWLGLDRNSNLNILAINPKFIQRFSSVVEDVSLDVVDDLILPAVIVTHDDVVDGDEEFAYIISESLHESFESDTLQNIVSSLYSDI